MSSSRGPLSGTDSYRLTSTERSLGRDCPCCEGRGCEECDGTGKRITTYLGGGKVEMRVRGSAPLSEADKAALRQIGELAYERLKRSQQ